MVAERRPLDWALPATAPVLEALRHRGDPDPDGVIARFDESLDQNAPLTAATAVQVAGDPVATDPVVNAYLAERPWPDWADVELLARAQAFFRDHAWSLSVAFLLGSLPMSYCARDGALLLGRTGRLHDDAQRRIFETATASLAAIWWSTAPAMPKPREIVISSPVHDVSNRFTISMMLSQNQDPGAALRHAGLDR